MIFVKKTVIAVLSALMLMSSQVFATSYEIKDFGIKNINVPDEYMSCSLDSCDEDLTVLLRGNGYTFDQWKTGILIPNKFQIYACNKDVLSDCLYLICEKLESPTTRDGDVSHKLASDYNLLSGGEEMSKVAQEKQSTNNLDDATWITDTGDTPYLEYLTVVGDDYCHCYETIYNGNLITLQFSSKEKFSKSQINYHRAVLNSISYNEIVDYTEVKKIIEETLQKKLEEETHSGENTKILRITITVSVVLVIGFAIIMAIRSQHKKRRKMRALQATGTTKESDNNKNK